MCDTLSNTTSNMPTFLSFDKFIRNPNKSITQPDNGHKSDSINKLDYKQESERLKTFVEWKSEAVRAEDLAKAGFYFLNNPTSSDLVKCAFCNAEICNWESGDDPVKEHFKWSPICPLAKEQSSNRDSAPIGNRSSGQDVCGNVEIFANSIPESEAFRLLSNMVRNYADEKVRLESFSNWPSSSKQQPAELAQAGFYYRGINDHAVCYKCNGALRDWKDEDDPWEQHTLWFPTCEYVLANKSSDYIDEVQRKFKDVSSVALTKESEECKKEVCEKKRNPPPEGGVLLCHICDVNERNTAFLPCKHILTCDTCSRQLENCPVCRSRIDSRMKVFLS